jgi:hypothetical protein
LKRLGDMLLPDDFFKTLRSVFSGKDAVAHRGRNLGNRRRNRKCPDVGGYKRVNYLRPSRPGRCRREK